MARAAQIKITCLRVASVSLRHEIIQHVICTVNKWLEMNSDADSWNNLQVITRSIQSDFLVTINYGTSNQRTDIIFRLVGELLDLSALVSNCCAAPNYRCRAPIVACAIGRAITKSERELWALNETTKVGSSGIACQLQQPRITEPKLVYQFYRREKARFNVLLQYDD
jgi:hypothetical protein